MDDQAQREAETQSPEVHEDYVKDELEQENITHEGDYRTGAREGEDVVGTSKGMGAVEDEVVSITPMMAGPADIVGEENENAQGNETGSTELGEESVDPRDHLTPG